MGDEVNYEAAQEETDYEDQEEEEDDEGGDTDSIKTYVKSIIPFDDNNDDKRNPHATSSPKRNIQLYFIFVSNLKMKYNPFYLCKLHLFPNYYCNPNQLKMSRQTNGFN